MKKKEFCYRQQFLRVNVVDSSKLRLTAKVFLLCLLQQSFSCFLLHFRRCTKIICQFHVNVKLLSSQRPNHELLRFPCLWVESHGGRFSITFHNASAKRISCRIHFISMPLLIKKKEGERFRCWRCRSSSRIMWIMSYREPHCLEISF